MDCPRCRKVYGGDDASPYRGSGTIEAGVELIPEKHPSGVEIHRCTRCGGAFVPSYDDVWKIHSKGAKRSAAEIAKRGYAAAGKKIRCVACGGETTSREWSFGTLVFVDVCIECRGVWFDGGELEALS